VVFSLTASNDRTASGDRNNSLLDTFRRDAYCLKFQ